MPPMTRTCPNGHPYEPTYADSDVCPVCEAGRHFSGKETKPLYDDESDAIPHPRAAASGVSAGSAQRTASIYDDGHEPVVGWLVAVAGPMKGQDFRLRPEMNSMGRDPGAAVALLGDPSISAKQGFISYDPRRRRFLVGPGQGSRLTYRNGEEVLMPIELLAYDKLEVGQSTLLFIPFCGPRFGWDEPAA